MVEREPRPPRRRWAQLPPWLAAWTQRLGRQTQFFIVTGLADGMLTGLTLTAAAMLHAQSIGPLAALRVALAAALPTLLVSGAADYARRLGELRDSERQLNVVRHGQVVHSELGRRAARAAAGSALTAGVCSLLGAAAPLVLAMLFPRPAWLGLGLSWLALALLGAAIGRSVESPPLPWAAGLLLLGLLLSAVGVMLGVA